MSLHHAALDQLTRDLPTKSEKIRTLGRAGVATAEIARFLDIRYQHARNVLVEAGIHAGRDAAPLPASQTVTTPSGALRVNAGGEVVIPADVLARAGLAPGDEVVIVPVTGGVELLSRAAALLRAQEIVRRYIPAGSGLVDELLADRRRDALRDTGGAA